jgi:hypothetical protein
MAVLPEATQVDWARLNERLAALEARVYALEHAQESATLAEAQPPSFDVAAEIQPLAGEIPHSSGVFPILGKALLGIAGAYLLRAVSESGVLPQMIVAIVAILFAAMWMVWARRLDATDKLASTVYAITSALIFAPMLWELTLRFHLLNAASAAAILGVYSAATLMLAWRRENCPVGWVGNFSGVALAVGLAFATHDPAVFLIVLMLLAVLGEIATGRSEMMGQRALNAAALDIALWATLFIYAGAAANRVDYASLQPGALVLLSLLALAIYVASVLVRTVLLGKRILLFECAQLAAVFILAVTGLLNFGGAWGKPLLGGVCFGFAALSYALALTRFDAMPQKRNVHVFASWSLALVLGGCWLLLDATGSTVLLSIAAVAAMGYGARRPTTGFHGLVYLVVAAVVSGLVDFTVNVLAGSFPAAPGWMVWLAALMAIATYALAVRMSGAQWEQRVLQFASGLLAITAGTALLLFGIVQLAMLRIAALTHQIDLIRTLTVCVVALALGYAGARWQRRELAWMDYGMLVLVGGKILLSDALHGHLGFIAAAIFLYALTFILLPRVVKMGQRAV